MGFLRTIGLLLPASALLLLLAPLGARGQAASEHYVLRQSTFGAAGSVASTTEGGFRIGSTTAQDSVAGWTSSGHFKLKAGFWSARPPAVPGDCDHDGTVSIGEVQRAINMFLGIVPAECNVDCDGNGTVSIGEVQKVINSFLGLASSC